MPRYKQAQTVHKYGNHADDVRGAHGCGNTAATDREYTLIWNTH